MGSMRRCLAGIHCGGAVEAGGVVSRSPRLLLAKPRDEAFLRDLDVAFSSEALGVDSFQALERLQGCAVSELGMTRLLGNLVEHLEGLPALLLSILESALVLEERALLFG